jgi:hypothetical protein
VAGVATATRPKRGHSYRVILGTFSWSSDTTQLFLATADFSAQTRRVKKTQNDDYYLTKTI